MAQNTCNVCNQSFNSDRELQEHQRSVHSQYQENEKQSGSEPNRGDQDQLREKIA